ncbi:hypothetical protein [Parvularcula sp. LCG005]|uniref:hypothetical protein n=1 Tax=Parvularcula sp. LCG005 TaxID=3078805 RepID=UPI0029431395|nr:hypothetical protein [Parvularcula sp. LCG005]WOI51975.1 hypothetical protein RUI03_07375 [Parvularcula sp. LCG005]
MPKFTFSGYGSGSGSSGSGSGSGGTGGNNLTGVLASIWLAGVGVPNIATAEGVSTFTHPVTEEVVTLEEGANYLDLATGTAYAFDDENDEWDAFQPFGGGGLLFDTRNPTTEDGYDGATWLNTNTGSVYEKDAGAWSQVSSLVGPAGPTGPANGREFRSFAGVPTDEVGKNGDTGLNRLTGDLYVKAAETWTLTGQNISGPQGADGKSAFQLWLDAGNTGTLTDYFLSNKGDQGEPGSPGGFSFRTGNGAPNDVLGINGDAYADRDNRGLIYIKSADTWIETGDYIGANQIIAGNGSPTGAQGLIGDLYVDLDNNSRLYEKATATAWIDLQRSLGGKGDPGKSAYELAVENGYVGTLESWLSSFDGVDGKSAYELAVDGGFVGSESAWRDSLVGPQGESAYELHVRLVTDAGQTPYSTKAAWLASLKGAKGDAGEVIGIDRIGVTGVPKDGTGDVTATLIAMNAANPGKLLALEPGEYRVLIGAGDSVLPFAANGGLIGAGRENTKLTLAYTGSATSFVKDIFDFGVAVTSFHVAGLDISIEVDDPDSEQVFRLFRWMPGMTRLEILNNRIRTNATFDAPGNISYNTQVIDCTEGTALRSGLIVERNIIERIKWGFISTNEAQCQSAHIRFYDNQWSDIGALPLCFNAPHPSASITDVIVDGDSFHDMRNPSGYQHAIAFTGQNVSGGRFRNIRVTGICGPIFHSEEGAHDIIVEDCTLVGDMRAGGVIEFKDNNVGGEYLASHTVTVRNNRATFTGETNTNCHGLMATYDGVGVATLKDAVIEGNFWDGFDRGLALGKDTETIFVRGDRFKNCNFGLHARNPSQSFEHVIIDEGTLVGCYFTKAGIIGTVEARNGGGSDALIKTNSVHQEVFAKEIIVEKYDVTIADGSAIICPLITAPWRVDAEFICMIEKGDSARRSVSGKMKGADNGGAMSDYQVAVDRVSGLGVVAFAEGNEIVAQGAGSIINPRVVEGIFGDDGNVFGPRLSTTASEADRSGWRVHLVMRGSIMWINN